MMHKQDNNTNDTQVCTESYLDCWHHTHTVKQYTEAWMRDVGGDVRWRWRWGSLLGVSVTVSMTRNVDDKGSLAKGKWWQKEEE